MKMNSYDIDFKNLVILALRIIIGMLYQQTAMHPKSALKNMLDEWEEDYKSFKENYE
jgi:hypothetical protein